MNTIYKPLSPPMLVILRLALGGWAIIVALVLGWSLYSLATGHGFPPSAWRTLGLAAFLFAINAPFLPQVFGRTPAKTPTQAS